MPSFWLSSAAFVEAEDGRQAPGHSWPEPETARKDLGRGLMLGVLFWFASLSLRMKARQYGARYRFLFMHPSGAELSELAALVDAGRLRPIVDRVFPFAEIEQAFAYLETGRAKGKVIVQMHKPAVC